MEKNNAVELSYEKRNGGGIRNNNTNIRNSALRQNNTLVVKCSEVTGEENMVSSASGSVGAVETQLGTARGGNNRRTGRKTRLLRKFWNQVTNSEPSQGRRAIIYSETVVEDSVAEICALPAATPVDGVILPKIRSLDSRALAALLKDLGRVDKAVRAFEIFDLLRSRSEQAEIRQLLDIYTYTTIVSVCTLEKDLERALSYVAELHRKGIKCNNHFYSAVMNACKKCGEFDLALVIFEEMRRKGCKPNVITYNTLIDIYGKMAQSNKAIEVLKTMKKEGLQPAIRTYNTAMIACNMSNKPEEALKVYYQVMESSVEPISTTYTALIMTYGKLKMLDKAIETFNLMVRENLERTSVTYANLLTGCEIAENAELGLQYFNRMFQEGIQPSTTAFNSVIALMCNVGDWKKATEIFEYALVCKCTPDAATFNTLFTTYNKYGEWQKIVTLFDEEIQSGRSQDISVYGTVVDALWNTGQLRYQSEALRFYNEARKNANLKATVDMEARDGGWNVWVPVASVGIAVFAIHKWLMDMRMHFDRYPTEINSEIVIKITRNRRDKCSENIKDAFVRIFRSMGAIFNIGDCEASSPYSLHFSLAMFRMWLLKPETSLSLAALIGLKTCDLKDPYHDTEHMTSRLSYEALSQQNIANCVFDAKCCETLGMIRQYEEMNINNFGCMAMSYLSIRPQLILKVFKLTREFAFDQSIAFDTVSLMDRFMANRINFNETVYIAILAAFFRIVIQLSEIPERIPSALQLDTIMDIPVGSVAKIEYDLRTLMSNDFRVVSVYRVAKLYYEWLSYSQDVPWVKLVLLKIYKMLQLALLSTEMSSFKPSIAAAAIIINDRKERGWIPEWPKALAHFTGYDDTDNKELMTAIQTVSRLEKSPELALFSQT